MGRQILHILICGNQNVDVMETDSRTVVTRGQEGGSQGRGREKLANHAKIQEDRKNRLSWPTAHRVTTVDSSLLSTST